MRSLALILMLLPLPAPAGDVHAIVAGAVSGHIMPRLAELDREAEGLARAARADCTPDAEPLRTQYQRSFDAWMGVSHLRFGPSEKDDRAFALAFWPDSRGATPRSLAALIADGDPVADTPGTYAQVSIAARGFYALEFLLYDDAIAGTGSAGYRCRLVRTVAADIAGLAGAIHRDWQDGYAALMTAPSDGGPYRSDAEAAQELFKALAAGLQFTADTRLGRPLGTFDKPRPTRADAYRSGRSLRNVAVSLAAMEDLALRLADGDAALAERLKAAFGRSRALAARLDDPVFAGVAEPQSRLRIEALQQSIEAIRDIVLDDLGPTLGVAAGFNALDGD